MRKLQENYCQQKFVIEDNCPVNFELDEVHWIEADSILNVKERLKKNKIWSSNPD